VSAAAPGLTVPGLGRSAPALVAVAHGSRDPAAATATRSLLEEVRRQRPSLDVLESYLDHERPRLADVLAVLDGPAVVVPLLLGAAYHSGVDIPAAVAAAGGQAGQAGQAGQVGQVGQVGQADVLGPDPLLLTALERRLAEAGVTAGDPATAVVLAAAGSADPAAVQGVRTLAATWAARGWWGSSRRSRRQLRPRCLTQSRTCAVAARPGSRWPATCSSPGPSPTSWPRPGPT